MLQKHIPAQSLVILVKKLLQEGFLFHSPVISASVRGCLTKYNSRIMVSLAFTEIISLPIQELTSVDLQPSTLSHCYTPVSPHCLFTILTLSICLLFCKKIRRIRLSSESLTQRISWFSSCAVGVRGPCRV